MEPHSFTDASGRAWHIYDFKVLQDRKRAVPINSWTAEARAFVAVDDGTVLVYQFGYVAYHMTEPKMLANQLRFAKPLNATAAQRMTGG